MDEFEKCFTEEAKTCDESATLNFSQGVFDILEEETKCSEIYNEGNKIKFSFTILVSLFFLKNLNKILVNL